MALVIEEDQFALTYQGEIIITESVWKNREVDWPEILAKVKQADEMINRVCDDPLYMDQKHGGQLVGMNNGRECFNSVEEFINYAEGLLTYYASIRAKRQLAKKRRREFQKIRTEVVIQLIQRDGYVCRFPGCAVRDNLTVDHKIAIINGGSDELDNLQLMCVFHNSKKGDSQ